MCVSGSVFELQPTLRRTRKVSLRASGVMQPSKYHIIIVLLVVVVSADWHLLAESYLNLAAPPPTDDVCKSEMTGVSQTDRE